MKDSLLWVWLSRACVPGSDTFVKFAKRNYSARDIYDMSESELESVVGRRSAEVRRLADKNTEDALILHDYCYRNKVRLISWEDEEYPSRMKQIEDPPPLLYVTGSFPSARDELFISVVGTRNMSEYGRRTAFELSHDLAAAGAVVVSGMALGIDGVASAGAISAGGKTVVVLGCGIDRTYPSAHGRLRKIIERSGAVITEFPPGTPPERRNFPIRNRIISGLSGGVLVVEGDMKSGSLITAGLAVQQGRDLYAVPGNVGDFNTEGPNYLIKNEAKAITCADDILKNYAYMYPGKIDIARLLRVGKPDINKCLKSYGVAPDIEISDNIPERSHASRKPMDKRLIAEHTVDKPSRKPRGKKITDAEEASASTPQGEKDSPESIVTVDPSSLPVIETVSDKIRKLGGENALAVYYAIVDLDQVNVDGICKRTELDPAKVMLSITLLEIGGFIIARPGGKYVVKM